MQPQGQQAAFVECWNHRLNHRLPAKIIHIFSAPINRRRAPVNAVLAQRDFAARPRRARQSASDSANTLDFARRLWDDWRDGTDFRSIDESMRETAAGRHVHCESEIKLGTQRRAGGRRRGGAGGRAGLAVRGRAPAQRRGCRDAGHDGDAAWIAVCVSGAVGAPGVYELPSDARASDVPNPLYSRFRGNDGRDAGTTVKKSATMTR